MWIVATIAINHLNHHLYPTWAVHHCLLRSTLLLTLQLNVPKYFAKLKGLPMFLGFTTRRALHTMGYRLASTRLSWTS